MASEAGALLGSTIVQVCVWDQAGATVLRVLANTSVGLDDSAQLPPNQRREDHLPQEGVRQGMDHSQIVRGWHEAHPDEPQAHAGVSDGVQQRLQDDGRRGDRQ